MTGSDSGSGSALLALMATLHHPLHHHSPPLVALSSSIGFRSSWHRSRTPPQQLFTYTADTISITHRDDRQYGAKRRATLGRGLRIAAHERRGAVLELRRPRNGCSKSRRPRDDRSGRRRRWGNSTVGCHSTVGCQGCCQLRRRREPGRGHSRWRMWRRGRKRQERWRSWWCCRGG